MRAVEWRAPEQLSLVERPLPEVGEGQALVAVRYCGICGSDLHSYRHGFAATEGQVLGHEFVGTVVAAPGVAGLEAGQEVTARPLIPCGKCAACRRGEPQLCSDSLNIGYAQPGAFADLVLIPRAVVGETVFPVSVPGSPAAGALVEPLAVAMHAIERGSPGPDDKVLVTGAGMIGLGVVRLLAIRGVGRIVVSEVSALRREAALAAGADLAIDPGDAEPLEAAPESDLLFECAGVEVALGTALRCLRRGGVAVLVAAHGHPVTVSIDRVVGRELELRGSIGYKDDFSTVVDLLESKQVDPDLFVTQEFPLGEIDQAFRTQLDAERSIKVLVSPEAAER